MLIVRFTGLLVLLFWGTSAFAQLSVSGQVESSSGEELPFVHVVNTSQHTVAVTDINGQFMIEAAFNDTLDFSLIGYQSYRILLEPYHFEQKLRVLLVEDSILLPGITIFERSPEPIIKLPKRESMTVTGVRGKEDIVQKGTIRFNMGTPGQSDEVVPIIEVSASLSGVFTYLYDRFSKDGKERRKYAETVKEAYEESVFRTLINDPKTVSQLKEQFQLSQSDYERLLTKFNEKYPDAKKMISQSEIMGLLYYFFSQVKP
ncbi:MAG: carboxypeptidase-like regulatory domain-containing protein [Cyclobacteriaceae bacterium]